MLQWNECMQTPGKGTSFARWLWTAGPGKFLQVQVSSCIHRSSPVWKYWEPWGPFSASSNTNLGDAKPNHLPNPSWGWPWIAPNHSICVPRPMLTEQQTQATRCGRSVRYIIRQSSSRRRKERSYSQLHIRDEKSEAHKGKASCSALPFMFS